MIIYNLDELTLYNTSVEDANRWKDDEEGECVGGLGMEKIRTFIRRYANAFDTMRCDAVYFVQPFFIRCF